MVISIKPTTHSRNSTMQKQTNLKRKEVKKEDKEKVVIEAEDKKDKKVIEVAVFIDYNYLVRFFEFSHRMRYHHFRESCYYQIIS